MAPKLYYNEVSPAARAVLLAIKALGDIDVEYKVVNLMAGEQFNPEYLKVSVVYSFRFEKILLHVI